MTDAAATQAASQSRSSPVRACSSVAACNTFCGKPSRMYPCKTKAGLQLLHKFLVNAITVTKIAGHWGRPGGPPPPVLRVTVLPQVHILPSMQQELCHNQKSLQGDSALL